MKISNVFRQEEVWEKSNTLFSSYHVSNLLCVYMVRFYKVKTINKVYSQFILMWIELTIKEDTAAHPYVVISSILFLHSSLTLLPKLSSSLTQKRNSFVFLTPLDVTRHNSLISPSQSVPRGAQCDNNE